MHEEWTLLKRLIWLWRVVKGGASSVLRTVTGAIIHITDALAKPAHELVAVLSPKQEGSGDPSPDNVRPISGRTGAAINNAGANLLNGTTAANILKTGKSSQVSLGEDTDGKYVRLMTMSGVDVNLTKTLKFKENTRYTIILTGKNEFSGTSSTHLRFVYSDGNSTEIYWSAPTEIKTIAVASAANKTVKAITTLTRTYNTRIYYEKPFGIFEGVVPASSFEEYQGQSILVSFTDPSTGDPLTVYGGTLTLNEDGSADLVVSWQSKNMGSISWSKSSSGNNYYSPSGAVPYKKIGVTVGAIICSCFKNDGGTSGSPWYGANGTFRYYNGSGPTREIYIHDERYSSAEAFKTGVAGELLVYEIATPQTYHFDNVGQLMLFAGENNIWVDASNNLTLTYYADGNVSDLEALNTLLGGAYTPGDVSDKDALNILLGG